MKDEEIRALEERKIRDDLTAPLILHVKRLANVVDVLPKPKWGLFGERCPRCERKLSKGVATVQSAAFHYLYFKYTYWRCGPEKFYGGGCGYEYGQVVTQVRKERQTDLETFLGARQGQG